MRRDYFVRHYWLRSQLNRLNVSPQISTSIEGIKGQPAFRQSSQSVSPWTPCDMKIIRKTIKVCHAFETIIRGCRVCPLTFPSGWGRGCSNCRSFPEAWTRQSPSDSSLDPLTLAKSTITRRLLVSHRWNRSWIWSQEQDHTTHNIIMLKT